LNSKSSICLDSGERFLVFVGSVLLCPWFLGWF
jgi:hypothetical protein